MILGRATGGQPITRGNLYRLLGNPIYRGEIVHKGVCHPGEHAAIIEPALWDAVQARLATNGSERDAGAPAVRPSLLAGKLFDENGERLVPTHAKKAGRRYRYYTSHALLTCPKANSPTGRRIPANDLERLASERIGTLLATPAELLGIVAPACTDATGQQLLLVQAAVLSQQWGGLASQRRQAILRQIIARVEIRPTEIAIDLWPGQIAILLGTATHPVENVPAERDPPNLSSDDATHTLIIAAAIRRAGLEMRLVVDGAASSAAPDASLIALIRHAHGMRERLLRSDLATTHELAQQEKVNPSYYSRVVRLGFLAPDIVGSIMAGRQPIGLKAARLLQDSRLPLEWAEQRRVLGFPQA